MKNRLAGKILLLCLSAGLIMSCGVKDVTDAASGLLNNARELLRVVDNKVESGQLGKEAGDFLDKRIENLLQTLEGTLQRTGGKIFDSANGTINVTFQNISMLLTQINNEMLKDSIPALVETLSGQLQMQVTNLSAQVQDIIVLTFGNVFILVDKATNSIVVIASIILLAIGVLIAAIIFIRKKDGLTLPAVIGLVLMGLYIVFFAILIFAAPIRGYVIAGFNFAKTVPQATLKPQVISCLPEEFTFGKNKRIILYGSHFNLLNQYSIGLYQGNKKVYDIPQSVIVEKTQNRIILGNFDTKLNWKIPSYAHFTSKVSVSNLSEVTNSIENKFINSRIRRSVNIRRNPALDSAVSSINDFFKTTFGVADGDYGLRVLDGNATLIEDPQLIAFKNPPPPAPKPDVYGTFIGTENSAIAVKNVPVRCRVQLVFSHPEAITSPFKVIGTVSPGTVSNSSFTLLLNPADIAFGQANNYVYVNTPEIMFQNNGNYTLNFQIDPDNKITESNEGNNNFSGVISVSQVVYDATITFSNFESKSNEDYSEDEYHYTITVSIPGQGDWQFKKAKDGEPNRQYPIGESRSYNNLTESGLITISTSCYEEDSPDPDDQMGSSYDTYGISEGTQAINIGSDKYKITGIISITKRLSP